MALQEKFCFCRESTYSNTEFLICCGSVCLRQHEMALQQV